MADSFKKIIDTTVNWTDLSEGGSATLLTTGAGESAVIKDVKAKTSAFTDVELDIDGFPIGTIADGSGDLSGNQIVPENSTVNVKATTTVYDVLENYRYYLISDSNTNYSHAVLHNENSNTSEVLDDQLNNTGYTSRSGDWTNCYVYDNNGTPAVIKFNNDGNSSTSWSIYNDLNWNASPRLSGGTSYSPFDYVAGDYAWSFYYSDKIERINLKSGTKEFVYTHGSRLIGDSYPHMCHIYDYSNGNEYLWGHDSSGYCVFFNCQTNTATTSAAKGSISSYINYSNRDVRGMVLDNGNILVYSVHEQSENHSSIENRYYVEFDPSNPTVVVSQGSLSLNGTFTTYVSNQTNNIWGGFTLYKDKALFRSYPNNSTSYTLVYACDFNQTTKTIDFTTAQILDEDNQPLTSELATTSYGTTTTDFTFIVEDNTSKTMDVLALGIEST